MGCLPGIVGKYDIHTEAGFQKAMTEVASASEGELRYMLTFDMVGQSSTVKAQYVLSKAELDRRAFAEQRKLAWVSAGAGIIGVLCGAVLQVVLTWTFS